MPTQKFVKLTREMLNEAKSSTGGYSVKQFTLLGLNVRPPPGSLTNSIRIPKKWRGMVIGREYPEETLKEFVALKDKHLTARSIAYQLERKLKRAAFYASLRAMPQMVLDLPDGIYDNLQTLCRETWYNGERIEWMARSNVVKWGVYPDVPREAPRDA